MTVKQERMMREPQIAARPTVRARTVCTEHPAAGRLHFVVDGYGNILAPLLPLLIPKLHLSLAAAGMLQMCFQLSNSVAAGVRPPRRPMAAARCCSWPARWSRDPPAVRSVWPANSAMVATVLIVGGLGGAAFHPPAAALVHRFRRTPGWRCPSTSPAARWGRPLAPLAFAPFCRTSVCRCCRF